ncbi:MAG TPA: saccharopine dehydrogenase NADP-binding domain-containing protein [Solirubrobacteraceae bacterium]|jgi:short subunit dehydrogenase-like uncharacterized protein|nr:saccharopine dehydrogenase NADP-binding domain-containing protein [Solirubrobacteraceae bacterium]
MARVAVYGATGYTGRLVAAELRDRGVDAVLCGRSGGKLRRLAGELGVDWPVRAAAIDDPPALRKALAGADAVISCAGPFTFYGAPVIEAALDVGAHYVDTTGEQPYIRRVYEHLDAPARRAGCAVIPAVGFDYLPGDLTAALAARGYGALDELAIAYAVQGFGMSRGTLRSGLEMLSSDDVDYAEGAWRPGPRMTPRETFAFPEPIGEQPVVRYPGGEIVTVPRHVSTRSIHYRWTASTFAPHPALAPAMPVAMPVLRALLSTPLRDLAEAQIDRLPEGPSEEARRAARWTIVAEARRGGDAVGRAVTSGPDMYGLTAVIAVHAAQLLAAEGFDRAGALAPAQAFDAEDFLRFLEPHGVTFGVEDLERSPATAG